jgi:hypothetical protein
MSHACCRTSFAALLQHRSDVKTLITIGLVYTLALDANFVLNHIEVGLGRGFFCWVVWSAGGRVQGLQQGLPGCLPCKRFMSWFNSHATPLRLCPQLSRSCPPTWPTTSKAAIGSFHTVKEKQRSSSSGPSDWGVWSQQRGSGGDAAAVVNSGSDGGSNSAVLPAPAAGTACRGAACAA